MKTVVPFFPMKQGASGKHVVAMRRALSKATGGKLLKWTAKFSPLWGIFLTRTLKKYQKMVGVPVTGKYDRATHNKLAPHYDAYAIRYLLEKKVNPQTKEQKVRLRAKANILFFYNNRLSIPYRQWRPYYKVVAGGKIPKYGDCSGSGAGAWWGTDGGCLNFTGFQGWGYGNTWTMTDWFVSHGRRVALEELEIMDVVMYRGHVAWVVGWEGGDKKKPIVFSFGSYPARFLRYNYRTDFVGFFKVAVRF